MVLTFGELLMRFSPDKESHWLHDNKMAVYAGGSELNIAEALAKWRVPVCYCTVMPRNLLSTQLTAYIKAQQIDISTIIYQGEKMGLYYLPDGNDVVHDDIIYDRNHSSFYDLKPGMIDWEKTLQGIRWFHFSAVSASLNETLTAVCEEALKACQKKSITVSVDLNYRHKLWQYGKSPAEVMPQLVKYCDIVIGNLWALETMLHIQVPANIHTINTKANYLEQAKKMSETLIKQFPKCKIIANTFRLYNKDLEYYACVYGNNSFYSSATYTAPAVTNLIGTGDSFIAGLIYGVYNHFPFQQMINFAAGAAFQKFFIKGDKLDKTVDEIKSFILHYH